MNTLIKNKKRIFFSVLTLLITLIWTYFIFSMSFKTAPESSEISGGLLKKILFIIKDSLWFDVEFGVLHNLFRKLAHFAEFFILGCFSYSFIKSIKSKPLYVLIYCLLVAITDETIQFFVGEGRSAQISDVLTDFSGAFLSVVFIYLIKFIFIKIKNKRIKN